MIWCGLLLVHNNKNFRWFVLCDLSMNLIMVEKYPLALWAVSIAHNFVSPMGGGVLCFPGIWWRKLSNTSCMYPGIDNLHVRSVQSQSIFNPQYNVTYQSVDIIYCCFRTLSKCSACALSIYFTKKLST